MFRGQWVRTVKMSIFYQTAFKSQCNPNKKPQRLFHKNLQPDSEIYIEIQRTQNSLNNFGGGGKLEELILPDFKTYQKATIINTVSYWCKDRQID